MARPCPLAAARFDKFAKMRLEGMSDVEYRSYDFLRGPNLKLQSYLNSAGQHISHAGPKANLQRLQQVYRSWGYEADLRWIAQLLREFKYYDRLKTKGMRSWPLRTPEETAALYAEHVAAMEARALATPETQAQ